MITQREIDQAFSELHATCGGVKEDYFGLLYLEREHKVLRDRAIQQIAFGGRDYAVDGFHFDADRRNLYIYQFKYSPSAALFKSSMERLIDKGIEQVFATPNRDYLKNQILLQLRSTLVDNRSMIDQICFRFVFTGDPADVERSQVLEKLSEDLQGKAHYVDAFFDERPVRFIVEFRSATGQVGAIRTNELQSEFVIDLSKLIEISGPTAQQMHVGFVRLADLEFMHSALGSHFFDRNIRYGLGDGEAVNRAISRALRKIVIDRTEDPALFAFNHNGVTLFAEKLEKRDGKIAVTAPRLLNGAQTVTTATQFRQKNSDNPKLAEGNSRYEAVRVLCRVITDAEQEFVTHVTINNNRQNPVEPWNLHANDMIQLELQDKFQRELHIYYERQENSFSQLSTEDLAEYGIREDSKAVQMIKLAQTFMITDGTISRLSELRRVFEDDTIYKSVFRESRLRADARKILLCYKIERCLRVVSNEILERGQSKYSFISRARNLLWALLCQGLLNSKKLDEWMTKFGDSLVVQVEFKELLLQLASTRVRPLLGAIMKDPEYQEQIANDNLGFLRSDKAFNKCMEYAHQNRDRWVHKKLP